MVIDIPANVFASVSAFYSEGEPNLNMNMVHVVGCGENTYVEAVNQHAACRYTLPWDFDGEIIVPVEKAFVKACRTKKAHRVLIDDDLSVRVADICGGTLAVCANRARTEDADVFVHIDTFFALFSEQKKKGETTPRAVYTHRLLKTLTTAFPKDLGNFLFDVAGVKNGLCRISVEHSPLYEIIATTAAHF